MWVDGINHTLINLLWESFHELYIYQIITLNILQFYFNKPERKIKLVSSSGPYSSLGLPDKNRGCLTKFEFNIKQQRMF